MGRLLRKNKSHAIFFVSLFTLVMMVIFTDLFVLPKVSAQDQKSVSSSELLDKLKENRVTIRGEDLSVALLLRTIGRKGGVNIMVADSVTDNVTVEADNMTLYDLFMVIMDSKKLQYTEKNQFISVAKPVEGQNEDVELITAQLCAKFGTASEFLDQLVPLLSESGALTVSERSNCFVAQDNAEQIARISDMLEKLDQPIAQVHIQASIVSVTKEAKRQLGIKWGYANYQDEDAMAMRASPITASSDNLIGTSGNLIFGILNENLNLGIELNALQEDDLLRILSSPQILVLDGKEAEIKQGKEVPFVAQSGDSLNTSFREANLSLKVTPKVREMFIALDILVNNDSVDQTTSSTEPLINKQEISTTLLLKNGVTVVIGGIIENTEDFKKEKVPGLSSIPLFGNLFKSTDNSDSRRELLVFLTPNIISLENDAAITPVDKSFLDEYSGNQLLPAGAGIAPDTQGEMIKP